jgi:gliding motility-associated-like protein
MHSTSKLIRRFLLATLVLFAGLGSQKAFATHVAAADLYLDYIGTGPSNLKYKVTLVVYKACEPFSSSLTTLETVTFNSVSCGQNISKPLPMTGGPDTLDQLCANFSPVNACRVPGSVWPAFERRIYTDTITLPLACVDWKVSWSLCCRNGGITNLDNPGGYNLYIETGINNVAKWNNSTPRFIIDPIPYLCVNQPAFFLNGPLDPNNDSMISSNAQPLTGAGQPIPYSATPSPGFSLANPVQSPAGSPYTVNQNTGTATFTPTSTGKFVLAFRCTEYDRYTGTELSYITRDVQVSVLNCSAAPPGIDSTPETNLTGATWIPTPPSGGYVIACPGVPFSFDVAAESQTVSNSVFLSANHIQVAPGSTFNVNNNGSSNPTGTFSWTPTGADIGDHTLIITAKDSTCNNNQPIVLKNYLVVFIKVLPGVDAGPDGAICALDGTPWQFNVSGPPNVNYIWTSLSGGAPVGLSNPNIGNPTAYPPYDFTYVVYTPDLNTNCKNRDTVTIAIDTTNSVNALPDNMVQCRPGYIQLDAQPQGMPPLTNLACGLAITPSTCIDDTVEVRTQYAGGTTNTSNIHTPYGNYRTAKTQILLKKSDLYSYGLRSGTLNSLAFNVITPTTTTYNNFTIAIKCTDRSDLDVIYGGFDPGATLVYSAPGPVPVVSGWNSYQFDSPYNWDSTKNLIVEICYSNSAIGIAASVFTVNAGNVQMIRTYTNTGTANICVNSAIAAATQVYTFRPVIRFNYCPAPSAPFQYTWTPGTFLSDSTAKTPLAYVNESTKYYVTTRGRNGCKVRDSVVVTVPVHDMDVNPREVTICSGQSIKITASGGATYQWYENDSYYAPSATVDNASGSEVMASPMVDTRYNIVIGDNVGCYDTLTAFVKVNILPVVNIINSDTTIKYGQNIQLLVSGAYLYSWSPVSTLTNPNIVNPFASPTEPTTYYVYGLAENGCRNVDSVHINIDYRDNLFVPSAFTPNGDGKNDVFRVANLTFQKLQEFRIFNRWGQEIYSTNDSKKGWDGSWKSIPQDMGSYQYLIRVAYPDGYIETYKGNVTLVR